MIITNVQIRDTKTETRLEGVASLTFDGLMVIHDIKIISNTDGGFFLAMPSRKLPNGTFKDIAHPISKEARTAIENIVIGCFTEMRKSGGTAVNFVYRSDAGHASMLEQTTADFNMQVLPEAE